MLYELTRLLATISPKAERSEYSRAIIEDNCLGKATRSTRALTNQRLGELYALDPKVTLFRVLRKLWDLDEKSRPLLALLCALARDPLLRATMKPVLSVRAGDELIRKSMTDAIADAVGGRLNGAILDKVVRNVSSSWAQSGHFVGRTRKIRKKVSPSPIVVTFASLLNYLLGCRGGRVFSGAYAQVLDSTPDALLFLAMDAKRMGLMDLKQAGSVTEIGFSMLLTAEEVKLSYESN